MFTKMECKHEHHLEKAICMKDVLPHIEWNNPEPILYEISCGDCGENLHTLDDKRELMKNPYERMSPGQLNEKRDALLKDVEHLNKEQKSIKSALRVFDLKDKVRRLKWEQKRIKKAIMVLRLKRMTEKRR